MQKPSRVGADKVAHHCISPVTPPAHPLQSTLSSLHLWPSVSGLSSPISCPAPLVHPSGNQGNVCLVDLVSSFHNSVSPLISLFHACSYIPLLNSKITRNLISPTQKLFSTLGPIKYGQRIQEHAMTYWEGIKADLSQGDHTKIAPKLS